MPDYCFIFILTRESSFVGGHLSIGHVTFYNSRHDLADEHELLASLFLKSPPYDGAKHDLHMRANVVVRGHERDSAEVVAQEEIIRACEIANRYVPLNYLRPMMCGVVRDLGNGELSQFGRWWFGSGFLRGNMPNTFPLSVVRQILLKQSQTALERAVIDSLSWTGRVRDEDPQIFRFLFPWIACETLMATEKNSFMPKPKIECMLGLKERSAQLEARYSSRVMSETIERLVESSRALRKQVAHEGYRTLTAITNGDHSVQELRRLALFTASAANLAIEYCCAAILLTNETVSDAWRGPDEVVRTWRSYAGYRWTHAVETFYEQFYPRASAQQR